MHTKILIFITLLAVLMLTACSNATAAPATAVPGPAIPTASATGGVVAGRLLSQQTGIAWSGRYVSLAGVNYNDAGEGAFFVDTAHSPTTQTDENGYFRFANVPPQNYVLVVGEPVMGTVAITDSKTGNPKIWTIEAGKITRMDEIRFDFPK
jgi:hypothetical protein